MSTPENLDSISRRSFDRRKQGLFKKGYELGKKFNARVAIIVQLDRTFIYRSEDTIWPPSMEDLQSSYAPENNLPWDFQTERGAYEAAVTEQNIQTPPDTPEPPRLQRPSVIHARPELQARVHKRPYGKSPKPNFRPRFHLPEPPKAPGSLTETRMSPGKASQENIWEQFLFESRIAGLPDMK
ncbi:hypothetical protein FGG08_003148 [Glutinoglossum americanum]|uniref:MADS-box domain-containing protein n=1 Tax=Glutinoglossum americanum TaxID=1670608 RepID=A0A9P8L510_9PEZI|nr:hypothetical protein FGG08_003148 [Glutinoglossum americanum]